MSTSSKFKTFGTKQSNDSPKLSLEEELALFTEIKKGCTKSTNQIIEKNQQWVKALAMKYRNYDIDVNDLIGEGILGLYKAIEKFKPGGNASFNTFAYYHVKEMMLDYIWMNFRIYRPVKSKAMKKLFFNLRTLHKSGINTICPDEVKQIASLLGVKPSEVIEGFLFFSQTKSTSSSMYCQYTKEFTSELHDPNAVDPLEFCIRQEKARLLNEEINQLDDINKEIIEKQFFAKDIIEVNELAESLDISQQAVYKRKAKALKKLKANLT